MAIYDEFSRMGDVFSLGHWGDVLFDNMQIEGLNESQQVDLIIKKITNEVV